MDFSKIILNTKLSPADDRDYLAGLIYPDERYLYLPTHIDHTLSLMPIKDQGSDSTCVAMAATSIKEWQEYTEDGMREIFSEWFIYMQKENHDDGMYLRDAMKILAQKGDVPIDEFNIKVIKKMKTIPKSILNLALNYRIKSYARIYTIEEMEKAIYLNGPVLICLPVYNFTSQFWDKVQNDYGRSQFLGYHGVTLVGYDRRVKLFKLRNSWGDIWGNKGYTFFPYEDFSSIAEAWTTIDENSTVIERYKYEYKTKRFIKFVKSIFKG